MPPTKPGLPEDGTLRLVSAPDPSREVRAAARRCLEWVREGVRFWDMAVAYRHGEAYLPLVEAVFIEVGILAHLHEGLAAGRAADCPESNEVRIHPNEMSKSVAFDANTTVK